MISIFLHLANVLLRRLFMLSLWTKKHIIPALGGFLSQASDVVPAIFNNLKIAPTAASAMLVFTVTRKALVSTALQVNVLSSQIYFSCFYVCLIIYLPRNFIKSPPNHHLKVHVTNQSTMNQPNNKLISQS